MVGERSFHSEGSLSSLLSSLFILSDCKDIFNIINIIFKNREYFKAAKYYP